MRLSTALFAMTALGFGALLGAIGVELLLRHDDPFDRTRVVAIAPTPINGQSLVWYVHHHADSSGDFLGAKLLSAPLPALGGSIRHSFSLIEVVFPRATAIGAEKNDDYSAAMVAEAVKVRQDQRHLDLCPRPPAKLVSFNRGYFDYDDQITLCQTARRD